MTSQNKLRTECILLVCVLMLFAKTDACMCTYKSNVIRPDEMLFTPQMEFKSLTDLNCAKKISYHNCSLHTLYIIYCMLFSSNDY